MSHSIFERILREPALRGRQGRSVRGAGKGAARAGKPGWVLGMLSLAAVLAPGVTAGQGVEKPAHGSNPPPLVKQAQRFLAQRGLVPGHRAPRRRTGAEGPIPQPTAYATWQALGPMAVLSSNYGPVTARISALALDPTDSTGNTLYLGTTGGGVWLSESAALVNSTNVSFIPLTDAVAALSGAQDASISIGALTVQPGKTGVILAGTGDPNDALDSYYGAGILRSVDGGNSWSLISGSDDEIGGQTGQNYSFLGEGFAGFAWSTVNPQLVVAAVSQAYEGTLVGAGLAQQSYEGLYYSSDAGATWHLATITDGSGQDVQGPNDVFTAPDGNAATSVVWNPVRQLFVAAVRYHGYYQSADGVTWTRMAAQPGSGLTAGLCPTNTGFPGSPACPIFRGTLAVNPETGDTFAWTVDENNQDQGLWQDQCLISGGACTNQNITFAQQWSTAELETDSLEGPSTIANGNYNLALSAVPSGQDTLLLAGANDLWKCSLAAGCAWRNTTNSTTCMSAQVGEYQHAVAWSAANPLEIFLGNDSGLWRSTDGIGETGAVCASTDASHFQNLNGNLGSLAEVVSLSTAAYSPNTLMTGLGVNGTAGLKGDGQPSSDWPEVLGGEGGPVAIDPNGNNPAWYVNNQAGVSIYRCAQSAACTPSAFGDTPVIDDADVNGDGLTMTAPAPFLVDPEDNTQLLIGTCRIWRGPASGVGWSSSNAISPILDGSTGVACNGDALIRSMAALAFSGGSEQIYVGMYGSTNGGSILPGHVFGATYNPGSGTAPVWQDLTLNPVLNDSAAMNAYGYDISSLVLDAHDSTGNTVYVTVEGVPIGTQAVRTVYRSTDGGAHWANLMAKLPWTPANSLAVDPQDANTVYIATDAGVFSTRTIAECMNPSSNCWSAYGTGLPDAPVTQLSATSSQSATQALTAATYGRGVWRAPLWTTNILLTTATVTPISLTFPNQVFGTASSAQRVTLKNTGSVPLTVTGFAMSGDFSEADACQSGALPAGVSCAIQVVFTPSQTGNRTGQMTISANVSGGQLTVALSGTGVAAGAVSLTPASIDFGQEPVGSVSAVEQVTATNTGGTAIAISSVQSTAPFQIASNACGSSLAAGSACQVLVEFAPTQRGAATGKLTFTDAAGTQSVQLSGNGEAPPTDTLSVSSLKFPNTVIGLQSAPLTVVLTNSGDLPLFQIGDSVSGSFQATENCGTFLPGHSSCAFNVIFIPTSLGSQNGSLIVSDALRDQTVTLSGTGVTAATISVSPPALSFAATGIGVPSAPSKLTVTNTGGAPMGGIAFCVFTSSNQQCPSASADGFAYGATTCGGTLAPGGSCTVQVTFTPAVEGGSAATLNVSSSTFGVKPAGGVNVPLNGTVLAPGSLDVSPLQLAFPTVTAGDSSPPQTVTVSDSGGQALASLNLSITGPFSLAKDTCAGSLAAGKSCTTGVIFSPTSAGPVTGALTVSSTSAASPVSVALSGTGGVAPGIQLTPQVLTFSTLGVGATSSPLTLTVTNPGSVDAVNGLALKIAQGTQEFQLVNNTCTATLAPQGSCTAGVVFAPNGPGTQTGALSVTSSTAPPGGTAPLRGDATLTGVGFDFAVTPAGSPSQTVSNGQTASFPVTITLLNNSPGAVFTFQCGVSPALPPYSQCVFGKPSIRVSTGTTGYAVIEVATGLNQTAQKTAGPARWRMLPLACGLVLLPLAWRRRRRALLLAALLAILAGGVSSCTNSGGGGGTTPPPGQGITPPGTYQIPVLVLSNGIQHPVKPALTMTVD